MLAVCIGIFISGGFVAKKGRYYPFLLLGYVEAKDLAVHIADRVLDHPSVSSASL